MILQIQNEHRLTEVEERSKSNTHRIDKIEKRQDDLEKLATSVEKIAIREEGLENDVKEIKSDVKSLKDIPAKRWETVITVGLTAIISALVGFIIAKIF
jgi:outer membrane murein-binding lipoprotein Lpp